MKTYIETELLPSTDILQKWEHYYCRLLFLFYPIAWFLHIPGTLGITSALFIGGALIYMNRPDFRRIIFSWPLFIWLALTVFHLANGFYHKVPGVDFVDILHGFKIYSCIAIFTYWFQRDFWGTVKELLITFGFYMVVASFVCDFGDEDEGRMSGAIYATQLGQTVAMAVIYIVLWAYYNHYKVIKTLVLSAIPLFFIILAQTRNPMMMVIIIIIGYLYAVNLSNGNINLKLHLKVLLSIAAVLALAYVFVKDSGLGNRLSNVSVQYRDTYQYQQYSTGTIFDLIVGDRLIYYIVGFSLFLRSPIIGIGMWNYRYITGGVYPLHSEYMVHLCEGGIIALTLWLSFIIIVLRRILLFKTDNGIKQIALMGLAAILFCGIYAREFFYEFFYPAYGLFLALYYHKNESVN